MQIEKITTALRPRNHWETLDLGFNMAQRWYLPLALLWLATAIPIFVLLHITPFLSVSWALVMLWWLKPLYEQVLLYYISRALFGEYPPITDILKQYWSISKTQLFPMLLWRRFSLSRSFNNPVAMLEGLHGQQRGERLRVLHYTHRSASQWLHIFCFIFELVLWLSLCSIVVAFFPEDSDFITFKRLFDLEDGVVGLIGNFIYLICMAIIAPFYVCAGFSLYLTRRTELEGWDIELSFKRIAERLRSMRSATVVVFAMLCFSIGSYPNPVFALEQDESKEIIQEVLEREEFGKLEKVNRWSEINPEKEEEDVELTWEWLNDTVEGIFKWFDQILPGLAALLEFLLWASVIFVILYLIARFTSWLDWMGLPQIRSKKKYVPPSRLFGLEVRADSLPEDAMDKVRQLLADGKIREGLSLLYRATLIQLIHLHQLEIADSATEGECQRLVQQARPDEEANYFSSLTRVWLLFAYAHEAPDITHIQELCDIWPSFYEIKNEA